MLIGQQDPILNDIEALIILEIAEPILEEFIKINGFLLIPDENVSITQQN